MAFKLSKADQLLIIQQLRYGHDWSKIKQSILDYQYCIVSNQSLSTKRDSQMIVYQIQSMGEKVQVSDRILENKERYFYKFLDQEDETSLKTNNKVKDQNGQSQLFEKDRYFRDDSKCSNCHKNGHEIKNCPEPRKCQFCLCIKHNALHCTNKDICLNCFHIGHQSQNCKETQIFAFCSVCERKHLSKYIPKADCYSLTKGTQQKKVLFHTESFNKSPDILCMRCKKYGHLYQC